MPSTIRQVPEACSSRAPQIIPDKTNSTLTIEDSGIGMTKNDSRPCKDWYCIGC